MLKLNKNEINELLESKRANIEQPVWIGLSEFISGISLLITLCASQFNDIPIIGANGFKVCMFLISIIIIGLSIRSIAKSVLSRQTVQNLMENILELDEGRIHIVNILLLKNTPQEGKYLLVKNKQWKCDLFPSYNSTLESYDARLEQKRIESLFKQDVGISNLTLDYIQAMDKHIKLCVGTRVRYRYWFHFYRVKLNFSDARLSKNFTHNGRKYKWKTLDQMVRSGNIMRKNGDVVNHVAELENIPYN